MSGVKTKIDILEMILLHETEIKNFGVNRLGLFGSYSREEQTPESDIDLLIEFEPDKKNFKNFMHLAFFLEEVLHNKVELVTKESLSPYLKPHILKEVKYVLS